MKKITLLTIAFLGAIAMNAQETVWEDSFENYEDFIFTDIGDWTQIDVDGSTTYGIVDHTFTNSGYVGTGIVFNPSLVTPTLAGTTWDPRTGEKGIYFFAATTPPNDGYFISPQIDLTTATGSALSFWAKSYTDAYGLEEFEVLLSTTGTAQADFTVNLSEGIVEPPTEYTEYTYDLSAYDGQKVYFAVHYVGNDHFALQLDDFAVTATSLGIHNVQIAGFEYFYTPTTNRLTLSANERISHINLYNILGQQVISKKLSATNEVVSLDALKTGIYLAKVEVSGKLTAFKIVKR